MGAVWRNVDATEASEFGLKRRVEGEFLHQGLLLIYTFMLRKGPF